MAVSSPRQRGLFTFLKNNRKRRHAADLDSETEELGVLRVRVIAARDLPAADRNHSSDPFFRIEHGQAHRFQSPCVKHTLNPIWGPLPDDVSAPKNAKRLDEAVHFDIQISVRSLTLENIEIVFWDKDKFSKDDYLGEFTLTLEDCFPSLFDEEDPPLFFENPRLKARWHDLTDARQTEKSSGQVLIKVGFVSAKSSETVQQLLQLLRDTFLDQKMGRLSNIERVMSTPPTRSFGTLRRHDVPSTQKSLANSDDSDSDADDDFDAASSTASEAEDDAGALGVAPMTQIHVEPADEALTPLASGAPLQPFTSPTVAKKTSSSSLLDQSLSPAQLTPSASTLDLPDQPSSGKQSRPGVLRKLTFPSFKRTNSSKSISSTSQTSSIKDGVEVNGKQKRALPRRKTTRESSLGEESALPVQHKRRLRKAKTAGTWSFGAEGDILGVCFLEVVSAHDLPRWKNAARVGFDMDPFIVISFGQKVFRTRVIRHSLNPKWEERLYFHVRTHESAYSIEFGVFDWDRYSANDHVGIAHAQLSTLVQNAPKPGENGIFASDKEGLLLNDNFQDETLVLEMARKDEQEAGKHASKIKIRARFTPYAALRQQFWRRFLRQFDTNGDGLFSQLELFAMLDALGSTLSTETINHFFAQHNVSVEQRLTEDQVVLSLERELSKDQHTTRPDTVSGTDTPAHESMGYTGLQQHSDPTSSAQEPANLVLDTGHIAIQSHQDVPLTNSDDLKHGELSSTSSPDTERIINIRSCPICHKQKLNKKAEVDIITHIAICSSQDWSNLDNLTVHQFVSSEQAHRKWLGKMVSRVTKGQYQLGADSGNIIVQNRMTGQLIEEKMQIYVRLGMRLGYRGMRNTVESGRVRRLLASMSVKQGAKFNSPNSVKDIAPFIAFHGLDMTEVLDPVGSFKCFNEFFYRKLKADARPVDEPNNARVLVSAADCRMMAFQTVSDATRIWIKGREFSIRKLLGPEYASESKKYEKGSLCIFRLAPQDYHRYHVPCDGVVGKIAKIHGEYYTVNPMGIRSQIDVYGENIREIVPVDSPEFGRVMLVTIGAMMVGSIVQTVEEGQTIARGQEFGYFKFGGSTIVCLLEPGVQFDQDILDNSNKSIETLVRVDRFLYCAAMTSIPKSALQSSAQASVDRRRSFEDVWPIIRTELLSHLTDIGMPGEAVAWFKRNLETNTPGGKLNRGMSVVDTAEILKGSPLTQNEYLKAAILGWSVELLQAYFLVADDIMDQSVTRRGQPCWYRVDGVGNIAINDAFMLEGAIYFLLKKHFRQDPYYVDLLELFHDVTYQTELGQLIDLITAPEDSVDLSKFSLEKHHLIVVYKTAFYSFYLPVALAMRLQSVTDEKAYQVANDILIPLGEYFQIQDDYLDCYADPSVLGKVGTDILDNKCSWLINVALKEASSAQRQILDQNYGRKDAEAERKVKVVYHELDLAAKYEAYEQRFYSEITAAIEAVDETSGIKKAVFTAFLNKIYKRQK